MKATELAGVLPEMKEALLSKRVQQVYQLSPKSYELVLRGQGESQSLFISILPGFSRVHTLSTPLTRPKSPTDHCMALRSLLGGSFLEGIEQINQDRHLLLRFRTKNGELNLYLELFSRMANGILTNDKGKIIECFQVVKGRKRRLVSGEEYHFPPPPKQQIDFIPIQTTLKEVEEKYSQAESEALFQQKYQQLERKLTKEREQVRFLQEKLTQQVVAANQCDHYLQWGELLKGNFLNIPRGSKEFKTVNYYDPELKEITIPLDPLKTPEENMAFYFKKYTKTKRSQDILTQRVALAKQQEFAILEKLEQLENHTLPELLEQKELFPKTKPQKKQTPPSSQPREYWSQDNIKILVGRTSAQNDELTMRKARGNDIFMHVQGFPGSHVIILTPKGKSVPLETLLDAATLAKYFSKAREHQKSTIDYCPRKYVRKPKGAKPGLVILQQHKSLLIEAEKGRLSRLTGQLEQVES